MSERFDPVETARAIGELSARVNMMPASLRPIGKMVIELCDVMLDARTKDTARIADLERQLAEARDSALREARYAAAMARWDDEGWPLPDDVSDDYKRGLDTGYRQQSVAVENALRKLMKDPTP